MKMIRLCSVILVVVFGQGAVFADNYRPAWANVYLQGESTTSTSPSRPLERRINYHGTKTLISSQLVQELSQKSISSARLLALFSGIGTSTLPDGSQLSSFMGDWAQLPVPDISLYRITYRSRGPNGYPVRLSGLVVVPKATSTTSDPDGILVYMHATTTQNNNVPSDRSVESYGTITAFAHLSIVLAMPDYLGYGVNKGNHPYAMGKLNAPAGHGMILATREFMKKLKRPVGDKLLITGYSEGGANALWLTRYLEELNDQSLKPTLSAPMSGPYDLSGATAQSFIGKQPLLTYQENFTSKPTLLSFAAVSTARLTKEPLTDLLQAPLALEAAGLFPGPLAEETLGTRLLTTSVNDLDYVNTSELSPDPEKLLQPGMVAAIKSHDMNNPAIQLWAENDNLDWKPQSPVMLVGILQDELVPYASSKYPIPQAWKTLTPAPAPAPYASGNAENLIRSMRARGILQSQVAWTAFNGAVQSLESPVIISHADGFLPCSIIAQSYFYNNQVSIPELKDPDL